MAENGNKKRRIARIGRMSNDKGATKFNRNEEVIQADCNLVFNIMQSMDKSQDVMSYQQLQEFRLKERSAGSNSDQNTYSKQNKIDNSKQIKKFVPEKTHPLMAKCQKSMKYLNKNRCIPKPRAHVGFIPRPSQNSISRIKPNNSCNKQVSNNALNFNESSMKNKEISSRNSSPEITDKPKKAKPSHPVDSSLGTNVSRTESFDLELKFTSDTNSDNEFEQFLRKHHPEKCVRRKAKNSNKFKRKKSKKFMCAKKITNVTSKILSESEDSSDREKECNETNGNSININEEISTRRYQRIVEYENSEESATDTHVQDTGTLNCDSFSSSEDEYLINKSYEETVDFDKANRLDTLPAKRTSFVPSISLSEHNSLDCDVLKLKCKIPCYVLLERDPLLDKRVISLQTEYSPVTNPEPVSNSFNDEDDCLIIIEPSTNNLTNQNSESIVPSMKKKPSLGESIAFKSFVSEALTNISDAQNNHMLKNLPNNLEPQSESNEKSRSFATSSMSFCDTEEDICLNSTEWEDQSATTLNPISQHTSDLLNNETDVNLNNEEATSAIEKVFNVQILSVKSLNESDIIVLSDDNEEKDTEAVPAMNETKENATEDSDVEIICLDSTINKKRYANVKDVLNKETENKVNGGLKENANSSSTQPLVPIEDDCVILDDLYLPNDSTCTAKNVDTVQQSSQIIDTTNIEKTNSNKHEETTSDSTPDSDKDSILKILGTIDFNCINKVLKETSTISQKENIPVKAGNFDNTASSERTPDLYPDKLKQSQSGTCLSQKQILMDESIAPIGPFDVNIKTSSLNTSLVDTSGKHPKLVQNSNVLQNIKSSPENVSSSKKLSMPSSVDSSIVCNNLNLDVPKSFDSEKEFVTSSHKTEPNALLHSQKIQQLLPVRAKRESYESPSDELDIIAAKSIQNLDEVEKESIVPLLELYKAEYERFMEIKCTEQNVTAGLKLLEEKQARKLLAISSSIKNVVKKDRCFHKINNEFGNKHKEPKCLIKNDSIEKDKYFDEMKNTLESVTRPSISNPDAEDKVKIFNQSVVERASEVLKLDGPSSSQEVYNHLINSVCADCGKHAVAACSGCAKIYYCSEECGMSYWSKGHYATCRR